MNRIMLYNGIVNKNKVIQDNSRRKIMRKDWTEEVKEYDEKIKGMGAEEADKFLWKEYYFEHRLSKRAYEWIIKWLE